MSLTIGTIKLTFYGGANEIGGNKVLLEDFENDVKVFIDFGINHHKLNDFKDDYGNPSTLEDLTKIKLMPTEDVLPIENLYSTHFIFEEGKKFGEKVNECRGKEDPPTNCDGIFISHAHRDHYYGLPFINRNIPIYTGPMTRSIIEANARSSPISFENFYYNLKWSCFRTGEKDNIYGMEIIPIHVDHSIPAAYGFIFCTSAGLIVYTGDFRMHGPLSNMTTDFIEKIKECSRNGKVQVLICEGTFIHKGSIESEANVKKELEILVESTTFDYFIVKYNRNDWDRFRTFINIAKKFNWNFVIPERDAYFYHILNKDPIHDTMRNPNLLKDDNILVLLQENYFDKLYQWQKELRNKFKRKHKEWRLYNAKDLKKLKSKFFLYYTTLQEPLSVTLPLNLTGAFISSDIDPYAEEKFDDTKDLVIKLRKLGIPAYRIQASGHAKSHDIYNFV
ncbi:MAG: MBL fold metallo-hydrolase, partial [Candidatus Hodarchaeota archaeon]